MSSNFEQPELGNGGYAEDRNYNSPSLKSLLALDLSHGTVARLEHDLNKVARILNLPIDWRLKTYSTNASYHEICQARVEWCLRWLLKALCTSDLSFTHVRANVSSWILLGWLISQLPVSLIARALNVNAFIKSIRDTLQENYSDVNTDTLGLSLKNLERNGNGEDFLSLSKNEKVETGRQSLFSAVDKVVRLILNLASNQSSESLANEHVKLSLKCDLSTASYIARLYIMGLNKHLLSNLYECINKISDDLIAPAAQIWEINLGNAENLTDKGPSTFASQCTLPLLYTLVILEEPQMDIIDRHYAELSCKTKSTIQYLIAKYSLSCAPRHLMRSSKESERRQELVIKPIIQGIKSEITRTIEATDEEKVDSRASLALMAKTVPLLFRLIVRSKSLEKSLYTEDAQIRHESTFHSLAACLGVDVSHHMHRSIPEVCVTNVVSLIEITVDQNINLGIETLVFITKTFSGICERKPENVNWGLIEVLFRVRNDKFFRSLLEESDQNQDQDNHQVGASLLKNLLYHLARRSNEILVLQSSDEFHEDIWKAYDELKNSVLYPFLAGFVRTRNIQMLISIWRSELKKAIVNHGVNSELSIPSIWDDNELATHITRLLQNYISMREISDLCYNEIKILKEYVKLKKYRVFSIKHGTQTTCCDLYANMTILNCLLSSIHDLGFTEELSTDVPILVSSLLKLLDELANTSEMLIHKILWVVHQAYRVLWWEFDRSDRTKGRQQLHHIPWKLGLCMFEQSDIYESKVNSARLQMHYATIYFLILNWYECSIRDMHAFIPPNLAGNIIKYINGILNALCANNLSQYTTELYWNGNLKWIRSLCHLFLANVAVVVQYPQILNGCNKGIRRIFFKNLCLFAAHFDQRYAKVGFSTGISFVEILRGLSDWVGMCSITEIRGDFVLTMANLIENTPTIANKHTEKVSAIAEDQILRIDPLSIGRDHRETILNLMLYVSDTRCIKNFTSRLSIAIHLMETPNATAAVCKIPETLWTVAERLDTFQPIDVINILQLQDTLTQRVLTYIFQTQDQPRSKTFLKGFLSVLQKILKERESYLTTMGTLSIINVTIRLLRIHNSLLEEFEQVYVATLLNDLVLLHQHQSSELYLIKHIESLLIAFLSNQHGRNTGVQTKEVARKIVEKFSRPSKFLNIVCSACLYEDDVGVLQAVLMSVLKEGFLTEPIHELYSILNIITNNRLLLHNGILSMSRLLREEAEDDNCSARLIFLREMLSKRHIFSQSLKPDQELSSFINWHCDRLPKTSELQVRLLQLDCINASTLSDGRSMSQWSFENILAVITRSMLASDMAHHQENANYIFSRFCLIIRTLLICHRSKLKGTYHLLVQCLQALLAGFFHPYKSNKSSPFFHNRTMLLTDGAALDEHSAEAFCRILAMLCSPPPSSIKQHEGKAENQLTDQARKVKKYVGRFGINLLEHYCHLQLSARIRPEIRKLIIPGLFALLDTMEREAMKTLNARLDTSAQALWKNLYDEWKKSIPHSS